MFTQIAAIPMEMRDHGNRECGNVGEIREEV